MKYSLIEIIPNKEGWSVTFFADEEDRVRERTKPNSRLGYYYFPRGKNPRQAFKALKAAMETAHHNEILRLTRSLRALQALEFSVLGRCANHPDRKADYVAPNYWCAECWAKWWTKGVPKSQRETEIIGITQMTKRKKATRKGNRR